MKTFSDDHFVFFYDGADDRIGMREADALRSEREGAFDARAITVANAIRRFSRRGN